MPERDYIGDSVLLPHRARSPFVALEFGILRVAEYSLYLDRNDGSGIEIPVGMISTLLIEPGVSVTHEAIKLASEHHVLLLWVGEAGIRVYSAGIPGGRSGTRIVRQALQHASHEARMAAAKRLYRLMFDDDMPDTRSFDKLRGIEGAKVKHLYQKIAIDSGVEWGGRHNSMPALQDAIGFAASCLYGLSETVILASGYSPAIGVVHSGDSRSLVFDLADTIKFKTVIPLAFRVFSDSEVDVKGRVRRACRDLFREQKTAETLFNNLAEILGKDVHCPEDL